MEIGPEKEAFLIGQARLNREPIPKRIAEKPLLGPGDVFYMNAFVSLSTERQIGMDIGPVPWSKVLMYAHHYGLDDLEFDILAELISRMDAKYLDWQRKKTKGGKGAGERPDPTPPVKPPMQIIHTGRKPNGRTPPR